MHLRDVIKVMDEKEIERLLDKFDKSSLKNFELTQDDFKLALSKREAGDQVVVGEPTLTDKPDFNKQGDKVEKGDVVCVIEAMKMINEVKSDVSGTISNILVEDGSMVEYDQPLFQVKKG